MPREIYRVGADAAADFQDVFASPSWKVCESGNVRLNKIFSFLDFFKVLEGSDGRGGMTNVAGSTVPISSYILNGCHFDHRCYPLCATKKELNAWERSSYASAQCNEG